MLVKNLTRILNPCKVFRAEFTINHLTMKKKYSVLFILLVLLGNLAACGNSSTYEGYKNFENKQWKADATAVFNFEITEDTKPYQISYSIRNTVGYPYYNLYLDYTLADATGKVISTQRVDKNLLNPKTGEPYGKGIGDLYDHEFIALENFKFPKKGGYTFTLKQAMRLDPLPEIVAVGMRVVEKQ